MGALSEQELAAFSADFNKDNKNKPFFINLLSLKLYYKEKRLAIKY